MRQICVILNTGDPSTLITDGNFLSSHIDASSSPPALRPSLITHSPLNATYFIYHCYCVGKCARRDRS